MGPARLMLRSDHPILELLVLSTAPFSLGRNRRTRDLTGRHTLVLLPLAHILEIIDSSVVVVLARKDDGVQIAGVDIGNGMV